MFLLIMKVFAASSATGLLVWRALFAFLTAFALGVAMGPAMIRRLAARQIGQTVRKDGPQSHYHKAGTPTMGGLLIVFAITASTILWMRPASGATWVALATLIAFSVIGWADDYVKLLHKNPRGIGARAKFTSQTVASLAAAAAIYILAHKGPDTGFYIPCVARPLAELGAFSFVALGFLVITGSSNAVNLTDGLDGLAAFPTALVALALGVLAYIAGSAHLAAQVSHPFVPGARELAVFCCAIVGAALAFLWFNAYPAQVFMGDVGALALGAALGVVAVVIRQEILLFIMGGVFVAETFSVMLQVGSFKLTGRRLFRMAPLHHHFELKGWPESRVIVRFWIITIVLVLVGLSTLGGRA
ncbi:phospho-N-acetylmuramoyl-pentapeptide-transferase [Acidiferrobacter sp.]|uniref:phospho-N-acetylmuramoyl-pentapeptide- transferase n=1 Tax=Acidiferrobacter sp. TaxID=1872107 RepID=UPI0026102C83|nr:phospho-N-acetylmuramoyl-pentapeptide-transferase [Acidiferrobacter sp.]